MSINWICTRKSAARMSSFSLFPRPREPIPPHHLVLSPVPSSVITPPDSLSIPIINGFLITIARYRYNSPAARPPVSSTRMVTHPLWARQPGIAPTTLHLFRLLYIPTPRPDGPSLAKLPRECASESWGVALHCHTPHRISILRQLFSNSSATTAQQRVSPRLYPTGHGGRFLETTLEKLR